MRGLCQGHLGLSRWDPGEGEGCEGRGWIQGERRPLPGQSSSVPGTRTCPHGRFIPGVWQAPPPPPLVFKKCKLSSEEHVMVSLTFPGPWSREIRRGWPGSLGSWRERAGEWAAVLGQSRLGAPRLRLPRLHPPPLSPGGVGASGWGGSRDALF